MQVPLLVLNHNGRELLARCLPNLLRAAAASRHDCPVIVVDNDSTDGSLGFLAARYPQVRVIWRPNEGLCSYNQVLAETPVQVALLLNNDILLDRGAIDPLVEPLLSDPTCFLTAPLCWRWDDGSYDGQLTSIQWRHGLVRGTSHFPRHGQAIHSPGWTASAGAAIAVDRQKFLELGGFDPLFLPGRIEDLDLAYRAFMAGCHCEHVPASVAWHKGAASFGPAFGQSGNDLLAMRNTLLFQWKNLRDWRSVARQLFGLPLWLARDFVTAPLSPRGARFPFARALSGAFRRRRWLGNAQWRGARAKDRERLFFRIFHPEHILLRGETNPAARPRPLVEESLAESSESTCDAR